MWANVMGKAVRIPQTPQPRHFHGHYWSVPSTAETNEHWRREGVGSGIAPTIDWLGVCGNVGLSVSSEIGGRIPATADFTTF